MSRFTTLNEWLSWLEKLHPKAIDLGLQRVYTVATKLDLLNPPSRISHEFSGAFNSKDNSTNSTVITVAGTNGKGSCVSVIEQAIAKDLTQKAVDRNVVNNVVGSYTSPHLHHFCERIRIDNQCVNEALVCDAFAAIDKARRDISLTYFEFGTLAALWVFAQKNIPIIVLEVGLGGRLDAVNIVDADIAVVTSIDVDHEEWLGSDRNIISQEKLGVARAGRPLIIAETNLTPALKLAAKDANSLLIERDFFINQRSVNVKVEKLNAQNSEEKNVDHNLKDSASTQVNQWQFKYRELVKNLPLPSLPLPSVAAALVVLDLLKIMPVKENLIALMKNIGLPGRFQKTIVDNKCVIYDVAHNPAAATQLARRLAQEFTDSNGKTLAVMAVMSDKDHKAMLEPLYSVIDHWYLGDLSHIPRAARARDLASLFNRNQCSYDIESTIENAFHKASSVACEHDRIVVFGSFYTVAAIQSLVNH
jgi:dihydrofolate synthase/folylpolyglutamate synthase